MDLGKVKVINKYIFTILLFVFLFYLIDIKKLLLVLKTANLLTLSFTFILLPVNIILQIIRSKYILKILYKYDNTKNIINSILGGIFYGAITPFNAGEYWGRVKHVNSLLKKKVVIATLSEKLFTQIVVYLLGIISFIYFSETGKSLLSKYQLNIIITVLIMIIAFFLFTKVKCRIVLLFKRILSKIKFNQLSFILLITLINYLVVVTQYSLIIAAVTGIKISYSVISISFLFFLLKTVLPSLTIGDLGLRESISILLLTNIGIDINNSFIAGTLLYLINIILPSFVYLFFIRK